MIRRRAALFHGCNASFSHSPFAHFCPHQYPPMLIEKHTTNPSHIAAEITELNAATHPPLYCGGLASQQLQGDFASHTLRHCDPSPATVKTAPRTILTSTSTKRGIAVLTNTHFSAAATNIRFSHVNKSSYSSNNSQSTSTLTGNETTNRSPMCTQYFHQLSPRPRLMHRYRISSPVGQEIEKGGREECSSALSVLKGDYKRGMLTAPTLPRLSASASTVNNGKNSSKRIRCGVLKTPMVYQGSTPLAWDDATGKLNVVSKPFATRLSSFGMPRGFPLSCAPGYARFFYAYILHAFISNFSMSIATQALLGGFFAESTPQVWMIKDLAPSVIAAYLANKVASYELRPVYWMIVSVALSQGASIVDLLIPLVVAPKYLLAAAIGSAVVKHNAILMHFVARASVLQHFAIYQNLGEVQKKLNSFGMINFTLATALGIVYTSFFPSFAVHAATVVVCSITATGLVHYSLSHVAFRGLTPLTGQIVVEEYLRSGFEQVKTLEEVRKILGVTAVLKGNDYVEERYAANPPLSTVSIGSSGLLLASDSLQFTIGLWDVSASVVVSPASALSSSSSPLSAISKAVSSTMGFLRKSYRETMPFTTVIPDRVKTTIRLVKGKVVAGATRVMNKKTTVDSEGNPLSNKKLVLLVHRKCPPAQQFLAHLLCFGALNSPRALAAWRKMQQENSNNSSSGVATSTINGDNNDEPVSREGAAEDWEEAIRSFFSLQLSDQLSSMNVTAELDNLKLVLEASTVASKRDDAATRANSSSKNVATGKSAANRSPSPSLSSATTRVDRKEWVRAESYIPKDAEGKVGRHSDEEDDCALLWLRRTAVLVEKLEAEGWDVVTPSLDPIEGRIATIPETEDM